MSTPLRLKRTALLKEAPHGLAADTSRLRHEPFAGAKRCPSPASFPTVSCLTYLTTKYGERATQLRQQPHAALVAPQHLAASVRSPQVSVNLDNEGHCRQIRLAARWQDVYSIIGAEAALSPATTAFALHRLGCLFVYMSWQRRTELERSKLVEQLIEAASKHVASFGATEVTLALDGLARLRAQPPTVLLDALAQQALVHARDLTASQVPIILWAFTVLRYNPVVAVLSALDRQIEKLSGQMTAQGVSLVLSSYQAWRFHPEGGSLRALAANLRGRLGAFKNSELASCIEAFSALGYHPGNDIVQAVAARAGAALSPAALAKPVVNHRALDTLSVESRKAAADAASAKIEGTTAKEFGAAVSKSGRAAAANIKQRAQDAKTRLQDAGQDLLSGSRTSKRMVQDWLYEFGQWREGRSPSLCAAVAIPPDMPRSRWCFSSSAQLNYLNTL